MTPSAGIGSGFAHGRSEENKLARGFDYREEDPNGQLRNPLESRKGRAEAGSVGAHGTVQRCLRLTASPSRLCQTFRSRVPQRLVQPCHNSNPHACMHAWKFEWNVRKAGHVSVDVWSRAAVRSEAGRMERRKGRLRKYTARVRLRVHALRFKQSRRPRGESLQRCLCNQTTLSGGLAHCFPRFMTNFITIVSFFHSATQSADDPPNSSSNRLEVSFFIRSLMVVVMGLPISAPRLSRCALGEAMLVGQHGSPIHLSSVPAYSHEAGYIGAMLYTFPSLIGIHSPHDTCIKRCSWAVLRPHAISLT